MHVNPVDSLAIEWGSRKLSPFHFPRDETSSTGTATGTCWIVRPTCPESLQIRRKPGRSSMAPDRWTTPQHPASPEGLAYGGKPRERRPDAIFLVSRTPPNLPPPQQEQWQWQMNPRCLNDPSELFFLEDDRGPRLRRDDEHAKRICLQCPERTRCLEHALTAPEMYGIWGATTPRERAALATQSSAATRHGFTSGRRVTSTCVVIVTSNHVDRSDK